MLPRCLSVSLRTSARVLPRAPVLLGNAARTQVVRAMSLSAAKDHDYYLNRVKWDPQWIDAEAERIIAKGYDRHNSLGDRSDGSARPAPSKEDLENPKLIAHYPPQTFGDKFAYKAVEMLKPFTHAFFRDKYNHHAVVLETVAAVPGIVGGLYRHLRSLRRMTRDNGWIHPLWEESENERMHLLIWMKVTKPTVLEKALVMAAQGFYFWAYWCAYLFRPAIAHRFVGYLEEEAVAAYTAYIGAIDSGALPNLPAPDIAIKYYNLPQDAKIRDVLLYVRIDECMHRDLNHKFGWLSQKGLHDTHPGYAGHAEAAPAAAALPASTTVGAAANSAAL